MAQFTKTEVRRISFLSLLGSAAEVCSDPDEAYGMAQDWLKQMEDDGFFDQEVGGSRPTQRSGGRNGYSNGRGSSGRSSRSGNRGGGMRDPDGPPSDKQVAFVLKLTDEYSEDDLYDMTKKQVSDLIEDLNG